MKLTNFNELWSEVRSYNINTVAKTETIIMTEDGLDSDLSDVIGIDGGELLTVLKDGTVRKTIAYISERPDYYDSRNWDYPKYHIYDCQTMETMRKNERAHRYKKSIRDDGKLMILITYENRDSKKIVKELDICGNCWKEYKKLNKDGISKRTFNIKNYFEKPMEGTTPFIEIAYDYTTVPKFYSKNWKQISTSLKEQLDYTCQECGIVLRGKHSKYLHTHHVDANPSRNIVSNLKVVCIECHAKEFNHGHLKNKADYIDFVKIKRTI